jgi:hypothetical protein
VGVSSADDGEDVGAGVGLARGACGQGWWVGERAKPSREEAEDARRREITLFRYGLTREPTDPELTRAQRGRLVRRLAGRGHRGTDGAVEDGGPLHVGPLDRGVSGERVRRPGPCDTPTRAGL